MRIRYSVAFSVLLACITGCGKNGEQKTVIVRNDLDFARREVISIPFNQITANEPEFLRVSVSDSVLAHQLIDTDLDSIADALLVYVTLQANEQQELVIETTDALPNTPAVTYSRFVPERTDDYTWENDLVGFRTYGPTAQRLVEEGKQGGTLSSGLDCWLKRVRYPIIDKWYKKYTDGGTYHKDDGEGYDPYHVGKSRGCGGIGVWKDDSLYVSKNFVSYRQVVTGPVRHVFELTYAPWVAGGTTIHETKRITIDAGSQLYKVEEILFTDKPIPNITVGITLHDKKGETAADTTLGTYSYWEPMDDSELGTGVVIDPSSVITHHDFRTDKKDLSHLYVMVKPTELISYYTGFAWKKAGSINSVGEWKTYLAQFTQRLKSPLSVQVKQ